MDRLNNVDDLSVNEIDQFLLEKEKLWIGMLLTQHKGMNASHDWRRKTREKRNKWIKHSNIYIPLFTDKLRQIEHIAMPLWNVSNVSNL